MGRPDDEILPNDLFCPELAPALAVVDVEKIIVADEVTAGQHERPGELLPHHDSSSDYGGDEIDYEFFEQVEFASTQAMKNAAKTQMTSSEQETKPPIQAIMPSKPPWGLLATQPGLIARKHRLHQQMMALDLQKR